MFKCTVHIFFLNCALHDISALNIKKGTFLSTYFSQLHNYSTQQTVWDILETHAAGPGEIAIRCSPIREKYYERPKMLWRGGCCLEFEQLINHVLRSCYHVDIPFRYNIQLQLLK